MPSKLLSGCGLLVSLGGATVAEAFAPPGAASSYLASLSVPVEAREAPSTSYLDTLSLPPQQQEAQAQEEAETYNHNPQQGLFFESPPQEVMDQQEGIRASYPATDSQIFHQEDASTSSYPTDNTPYQADTTNNFRVDWEDAATACYDQTQNNNAQEEIGASYQNDNTAYYDPNDQPTMYYDEFYEDLLNLPPDEPPRIQAEDNNNPVDDTANVVEEAPTFQGEGKENKALDYGAFVEQGPQFDGNEDDLVNVIDAFLDYYDGLYDETNYSEDINEMVNALDGSCTNDQQQDAVVDAVFAAAAEQVVQESKEDEQQHHHPVLTNVLGTMLRPCGEEHGFCTLSDDEYPQSVCCHMTQEFLDSPHGFYLQQWGVEDDDVGCIPVDAWVQAYREGAAPPVYLEATRACTLEHVEVEVLIPMALDNEVALERLFELQEQKNKLRALLNQQPPPSAGEDGYA